MTRRNRPQVVEVLDDLGALDAVVVDKRFGQRSSAKKHRRNRHVEKQFIRHAIAHRLAVDDPDDGSAGDVARPAGA